MGCTCSEVEWRWLIDSPENEYGTSWNLEKGPSLEGRLESKKWISSSQANANHPCFRFQKCLFQSIQKCPLVAGLEGDWRFHLGKEGLLCDAAKQQKQPPHFVPDWLSLLPSMPLLWHRGSTLLPQVFLDTHLPQDAGYLPWFLHLLRELFARTNVPQSRAWSRPLLCFLPQLAVNFTSTILPYIEVIIPQVLHD